MKKTKELIYIVDKVRLSLLRGLFFRPFLAHSSKVPLIGKNVKILAIWKLTTGKRCYLGDNSYVECYASYGVKLGDLVTIRENSWIQCRSGFNELGEGLEIGNGTYIGPSAVIGVGGMITIGNNCQIGARFTLSAESHVRNQDNENYVSGDVKRIGISIGNHCWIGNNVTILDGVTIGDNVVIGAGSVVTKSMPSNVICYGVPARINQ